MEDSQQTQAEAVTNHSPPNHINQPPPPCDSPSFVTPNNGNNATYFVNHPNNIGSSYSSVVTNPNYGNHTTSLAAAGSASNPTPVFYEFPPGYRFEPKDEELIVHYLIRKVKKEPLPWNRIHDVKLYSFNPNTLAKTYEPAGEKQWYFFTPRDRKYRNGQRPNRAAGDGYWKATGADKIIMFNGYKVGFRKALVFYMGKPPKGDKTSWIMHEFRVLETSTKRDPGDMRLDEWVLCRIYRKEDRSTGFRHRPRDDDDDDSQLMMDDDDSFSFSIKESDSPIEDYMLLNYQSNDTEELHNPQFASCFIGEYTNVHVPQIQPSSSDHSHSFVGGFNYSPPQFPVNIHAPMPSETSTHLISTEELHNQIQHQEMHQQIHFVKPLWAMGTGAESSDISRA